MIIKEYIPTPSDLIKVALLKKIYQDPLAIAIKEMQVGRNNKYSTIDIVSFTNTIHAFEIKSDKDNFQRLAQQLEMYSKYSNYVSLVVDIKLKDKIPEDMPSHVGILIYDNGKIVAIKDPEFLTIPSDRLADFWWGLELGKFLIGYYDKNDLEQKKYKSLYSLLKNKLDNIAIHNATLNRLKERYWDEHSITKQLVLSDKLFFVNREIQHRIKITPLRELGIGVLYDGEESFERLEVDIRDLLKNNRKAKTVQICENYKEFKNLVLDLFGKQKMSQLVDILSEQENLKFLDKFMSKGDQRERRYLLGRVAFLFPKYTTKKLPEKIKKILQKGENDG